MLDILELMVVHAQLVILASGSMHKAAQIAAFALKILTVMLLALTKQHVCAVQDSQETTVDLVRHAAWANTKAASVLKSVSTA
jgi:hypothetical protein